MEINKIRDADFSRPFIPIYARLEVIAEEPVNLDDLNGKLTLEKGFRAKLSFHNLEYLNNKYKYTLFVVPQPFVPILAWQDATDYLIDHIGEVIGTQKPKTFNLGESKA